VAVAVAKGAFVVAAAGNDNADVSTAWPANCKGVISVAATTKAATLATYSNYGDMVTVAAPGGAVGAGEGIRSLYRAPFDTIENLGTSMAAPHISGIIGLMLAVNDQLQFNDVEKILKESYSVKVNPPCDDVCGEPIGLIDAHKAIHAAEALKK